MEVRQLRGYKHDKPCKDHLGNDYPNINQCVLAGKFSQKHIPDEEMYMGCHCKKR